MEKSCRLTGAEAGMQCRGGGLISDSRIMVSRIEGQSLKSGPKCD